MILVKARFTFAICLPIAICLGTASKVTAQNQTNLSTSSDYQCVQASPNARVWQRAVFQTNDAGVVTTNLHSYTEIATGLMYLANNQYVPAVEQIDVVADGAQAIQGQHTVHWNANANSQSAVNTTTSDGKTLASTVYGIQYYDIVSGSNVMLAQLKDCSATISGSNTNATNVLTYTDAFSGLTADIRYIYTKAGLSQDIVLRQNPPPPGAFGLNPQSTYIQVLTEFFNPPAPVVTTVTTNGVSDNRILDFGAMRMNVGHAFLFQNNAKTVGGGPVVKNWVTIDGNRTFLIEQVPYASVSNLLSTLHASLIKPDQSKVRRTVSFDPPRPRKVSVIKPAQPVKMAKAMPKEAEFILDYTLLGGGSNFTFQGDTTYLVTSLNSFSGTNFLEGGTVIKYTGYFGNAEIDVDNLVCQTSAYRPTVFTSQNDDSVGENISGSTGDPSSDYTGYPALYFPNKSVNLQNVRFNHQVCAISLMDVDGDEGGGITLTDFQILNCQSAFFGYGAQYNLNNGLIYNIQSAVMGTLGDADYAYYQSITGVNLTFHNCADFDPNWLTLATFENCLIVQATNLMSELGSVISVLLPNPVIDTTTTNLDTDPGVFQTVGAGSHYLANGSIYTNKGTVDIDAATLADLQTKTTYPPVTNVSGSLTSNYTFSPQVPRDNNGSTLALGYHYDCIDYALNISVSSATLTVLPGTALATIGLSSGISLNSAATFNCVGTATSPNYIVRYNTVQEQATTNWETTTWDWTASFTRADWGTPSSANFRFTGWSALGSDSQIFVASGINSVPADCFQDCQFFNGVVRSDGQTLSSTNCLFQRVAVFLSNYDNDGGPHTVTNAFCNDLFLGGSLNYYIGATSPGIWTVRDNLFDRTSIVPSYGSPTFAVSINNAFITNCDILASNGTTVILTNSPAYEVGTMGQYYYPTSLTALIHAGSRSAAAAGLYHYTVTTNNVVEGNNTVSIGFHYVATDAYGVPLDTTGDGLPDYVKDANGDGVFDTGDFADWLNPFNIYDAGTTFLDWVPQHVRLGYWRFNNASCTNEAGHVPTTVHAPIVSDWSGSAVAMANATNQLMCRIIETSGQTNFNCANGTVRFWYQPNWNTTDLNVASEADFLRAVNNSSGNWSLIVNIGTNHDSVFQFGTSSNLYTQSYSFQTGGTNGVSMNFQSGHWYQIVLTYSPTNIALYTNGALLATGNLSPALGVSNLYSAGNGVAYYPNAAAQASGEFGFGNFYPNANVVLGQLDELETFNYPLTPQAVAAGFPTSMGSTFTDVTTDSDYDGRSDFLESQVDGTNPNDPTQVVQCRLGYWRFDSDTLLAEQGQIPLSVNDISLVPSWSRTALNINSDPASQVTYWDVYTNGWANINCRQGCVRFWFKPNWNTHPPSTAPFVYLGNVDPTSSQWSLSVNISGEITFSTVSNSTASTPLTSAILPFDSGHWMQIVLNYGPTNTSLYTNGVLAATGSGVSVWPTVTDRKLGMVIGNSTAYTNSINGQFDEIETFNYQLAATDISNNFQIVQAADSDLNGIPDLLEDINLSAARPFLGAPVVITGTVEAEQFDLGGSNIGYYNIAPNPASSYRPSGMIITNCDDLGLGYCLDQTRSNEWTQYTINVLAGQNYTIETRVAGIGTGGAFDCVFTSGSFHTNISPLTITSTNWTNLSAVVYLPAGITTMRLRFLTNGTDGNHVGRFNYISIYPWWQAGFTSGFTNTVTGLTIQSDINNCA